MAPRYLLLAALLFEGRALSISKLKIKSVYWVPIHTRHHAKPSVQNAFKDYTI